jgi:hypothetical protein
MLAPQHGFVARMSHLAPGRRCSRRTTPFLLSDFCRAFKANASCRHHIPRQQYRVTNWAEYDASLCQRGSLTVWFSEEAIAAWAGRAAHDTRWPALLFSSGNPNGVVTLTRVRHTEVKSVS